MGLPVRIEVCGSDGGLESTELGGIGTGVAGSALPLGAPGRCPGGWLRARRMLS